MAFIREDQLRQQSRVMQKSPVERKRLLEARMDSADRRIFLSHAHSDSELVAGAVKWLENFGVSVYIDTEDLDMPRVTSAATAARLRRKILESHKVIVLATAPAVRSRWVSWELGLGDGLKGTENVVILPVADPQGGWDGMEFLQMYPHIDQARTGQYAVFKPNVTTGTLLKYL